MQRRRQDGFHTSKDGKVRWPTTLEPFHDPESFAFDALTGRVPALPDLLCPRRTAGNGMSPASAVSHRDGNRTADTQVLDT